jgi:hypothetical protein
MGREVAAEIFQVRIFLRTNRGIRCFSERSVAASRLTDDGAFKTQGSQSLALGLTLGAASQLVERLRPVIQRSPVESPLVHANGASPERYPASVLALGSLQLRNELSGLQIS